MHSLNHPIMHKLLGVIAYCPNHPNGNLFIQEMAEVSDTHLAIPLDMPLRDALILLGHLDLAGLCINKNWPELTEKLKELTADTLDDLNKYHQEKYSTTELTYQEYVKDHFTPPGHEVDGCDTCAMYFLCPALSAISYLVIIISDLNKSSVPPVECFSLVAKLILGTEDVPRLDQLFQFINISSDALNN